MELKTALTGLMSLTMSLCAAAQAPARPAENWCFPEPVASWSDGVKEAQREAARTLVKDLGDAIARGDKTFTVKPGHYRFGSPDLKNLPITAKDLTINAYGATFWFNGRIGVDAFAIAECKNLAIKGATVDYDPFPYTQGEIVAIDPEAKTYDVKIDPGFPLPDDWKMGGNVKAAYYTPDASRMRSTRLDWVKSFDKIGERLYRAKCMHDFIFKYKNDPPRVGDRTALPDRSMRMAFKIQESESVTLEDITVYSAPNMAFSEGNGEGGHVYRRCNVVLRPGTKRLLASNADVFHSIKVRKGPLIEDCEFSHACDDFINIHSYFSLVMDTQSPTRKIVVPFYKDDISDGVTLSFYSRKSALPLGSAKVLKAVSLTDKETIAAAKAIPEEIRKLGDKAGDFTSGRVYPYLVELDAPVETAKFDLVCSSDRIARGAVIRNNRFHDNISRGVIVRSEDFRIENNVIERTGSSAIIVFDELYCWEGPLSRNGLIKGNRIVSSGARIDSMLWNNGFQGAISVWADASKHSYAREGVMHSRIDILDNVIVSPSSVGIFMANTRDSRIEGNRIESPCSVPPDVETQEELKAVSYAIFATVSQNIKCKGNVVSGKIPPDCKGAVGVRNVAGFECDVKYDNLK